MIRLRRCTAQLAATVMVLFMLCGTAIADDEIAVIVARDAPDFRLNVSILRDIYLKKIFLDGHDREFIPLNLPPDHVLRRAFSLALFNKGAQELQSYWNQRYYHGITPPYVLGSPQAVVQFVAKTPGAIGYVTTCDLDHRVKQVISLPAPPSVREALEKLCSTTPSGLDQLSDHPEKGATPTP
jgi:hypothetical protein